jgi:hypothetical protein
MKKLLLTILTIALFAPVMARAETFPDFPMLMWGTLKINGAAAPAGTVLRAYYGSTLAGQITTTASGQYGSSSVTGAKLIVAKGAGVITFKVIASGFNSGAETGGTVAQTILAFSSSTVSHNFDFTINVANTGDTGGTGGSSGSGSTGNTVSTPNAPVVPIVNPNPEIPVVKIIVDANNDAKVDVLDFNTLMVHWGEAGASIFTDFNGDGRVDVFDFNLLMVNWTV